MHIHLEQAKGSSFNIHIYLEQAKGSSLLININSETVGNRPGVYLTGSMGTGPARIYIWILFHKQA